MTRGPGSENADQKRTRRRWINLAELVAVAGVLIAALTLWNSWSERRASEAERRRDEQVAVRDRGRFELRGKVAADHRSILLLGDDTHDLRDVRLAFPSALGIDAQDAVGLSVDRDLFAAPLLKATKGADNDTLRRLPVLVTYRYGAGDGELTRTAIFDVIWKANGHLVLGRSVELRDFRLRSPGGGQPRLDAAWAAEKPAT
ncbi:hypothetical protein [Sphingomonas bacterium]|uniref:hypothetical protein n=1 Tax=Sphingomonas bacterium TaxID=1895847 RepID=UPI001576D963|nr:hypothetical protein [Sphingomonas bacterium]